MKPESSSIDASRAGTRPVEVIFFDAAGTLIHLARSVGYYYAMEAERHGLLLDEPGLDRAFRMVWKQMPPREATRQPRPDDDKGWWRDLVGRVLRLSAKDSVPFDFDALFEDLYLHFSAPGVWHLYPEVAEVLATLRRSCRLAVISNFDRRLYTIFDHLGITGFFEKIIISSEAGADKPHPHIFEHALALLGTNPGGALFAGDDPARDWEAAQAAGMKVFRLERPKNSLTDLLKFPRLRRRDLL